MSGCVSIITYGQFKVDSKTLVSFMIPQLHRRATCNQPGNCKLFAILEQLLHISSRNNLSFRSVFSLTEFNTNLITFRTKNLERWPLLFQPVLSGCIAGLKIWIVLKRNCNLTKSTSFNFLKLDHFKLDLEYSSWHTPSLEIQKELFKISISGRATFFRGISLKKMITF